MTICISLKNNRNYEINESRLHRIMTGNETEATHMGYWDRFKDLFRNESKAEALKELFNILKNNENNSLNYFFNLVDCLAENNKNMFAIEIDSKMNNGSVIKYLLNGEVIKSENISNDEIFNVLLKLGLPIKTGIFSCNYNLLTESLKNKPIITPEIIINMDFNDGGVHKVFNHEFGVLKALDATGKSDFNIESNIESYSEGRYELRRYISTQKKLNIDINDQIDINQYAIVSRYNEKIEANEMDLCLNDLTSEQRWTLAVQVIDMLNIFYLNKVSHRDLHMHNLLVLKSTGEDKEVLLKVIDFGKSKFDSDFAKHSLTDIKYMFNREATSDLETFVRNSLRSNDSEKQIKHYPLHKIFQCENKKGVEINSLLSSIGRQMEVDLKVAGEDVSEINKAFGTAKSSILLALEFCQKEEHNLCKWSYV
ncbi:hypothetical protein [Shewanella surugensis]|uniref:Protein kinase domain-containing protein n=1 Tax=Shewanella surugensis TaxID=212020 RepID=A0ABT0LIF3_9GAMM|nr:hypothetical protein [Shewanella surugensis]MCL1127486.1 hypothetical protein [Shewanella surugensis]